MVPLVELIGCLVPLIGAGQTRLSVTAEEYHSYILLLAVVAGELYRRERDRVRMLEGVKWLLEYRPCVRAV